MTIPEEVEARVHDHAGRQGTSVSALFRRTLEKEAETEEEDNLAFGSVPGSASIGADMHVLQASGFGKEDWKGRGSFIVRIPVYLKEDLCKASRRRVFFPAQSFPDLLRRTMDRDLAGSNR